MTKTTKAVMAVSTAVFLFIALTTLFGDNIRRLFGMSTDALAGEASIAQPYRPGQLTNAMLTKKNMRNFGQNKSYDGPAVDNAPRPNPAYVPPPAQAYVPPATNYGADPRGIGDAYQPSAPNRLTTARWDRFSTFAIDVDTASYAMARRTLNEGRLPDTASVRVEEWVNAFDYQLEAPRAEPFLINTESVHAPKTPGRALVKVSVKGKEVAKAERQAAHLVFLVDTSCSMEGVDRIELARHALTRLTAQLTAKDTVAIATYAGNAMVVLEPTAATPAGKRTITAAVQSLKTGGGTSMGDGFQLAYAMAVRQTSPGSVSRVVVVTDGDTNLGANQSADAMLRSVENSVKDGVTLTMVGVGMGNLRIDLMEKLADKGNGQLLYFDRPAEVEKAFVTGLTGTLQVIAKDVKVQVEFDQTKVRNYRLVGYENRAVADHDFRNDAVDGGEIGAGHAVTALYEVDLFTEARGVLGVVRVRGQRPGGQGAFETARLLEVDGVRQSLTQASTELRFATAVAYAADIMRGNGHNAELTLSECRTLAANATAQSGERREFVQLLDQALRLRGDGELRRVASGY